MRPDTDWSPFDTEGAESRWYRGLFLLVSPADRWTWAVYRGEPDGQAAVYAGESASAAFARRYAEELAEDVGMTYTPVGEHLAEIGGEA